MDATYTDPDGLGDLGGTTDTFTAQDWGVPNKTVTVTAEHDDDAVDEPQPP